MALMEVKERGIQREGKKMNMELCVDDRIWLFLYDLVQVHSSMLKICFCLLAINR